MDRSDWLKKIRRETQDRYDRLYSPLYGEKYGRYGNATHQQFIGKLLGLLPERSAILDAACGAGRYFPMLLEQGHTVLGADQSQGMLDKARAKYPKVRLEKVGLQELAYVQAFEGLICMDAMENVSPEDWPQVLGNFQRALKPQGTLYFTVELMDEKEIEAAFRRGQEQGLPLVYGEKPEESVYHYYPPTQQVREWIRAAGLEELEQGVGDGYQHFLLKKAG